MVSGALLVQLYTTCVCTIVYTIESIIFVYSTFSIPFTIGSFLSIHFPIDSFHSYIIHHRLDMNEVSCFCNGTCDSSRLNQPFHMRGQLAQFNPNNPPYVPGGRQLDMKTLSMDAIQHISINYNTHSLYGLYEVNATTAILQKVTGNKRPFILTRSSYPGLGAISAKWLGDNEATWQSMKSSISGMLAMQMYGVALIGADICGFIGNTTKELCARWTQLGAYYPFSRSKYCDCVDHFSYPGSFSQKSNDKLGSLITSIYGPCSVLTFCSSLEPFLACIIFGIYDDECPQITMILRPFHKNPMSLDKNSLT